MTVKLFLRGASIHEAGRQLRRSELGCRRSVLQLLVSIDRHERTDGEPNAKPREDTPHEDSAPLLSNSLFSHAIKCYERLRRVFETRFWQAYGIRFISFVLLYRAASVAGALIMTSEVTKE